MMSMSMSVSALFGSMAISGPTSVEGRIGLNRVSAREVSSGLMIECSSRPQKKATAHHMKTRPKKTAAWEIRRRPTLYAPLPPLPADFTVVGSAASESSTEVESSPASAPALSMTD